MPGPKPKLQRPPYWLFALSGFGAGALAVLLIVFLIG